MAPEIPTRDEGGVESKTVPQLPDLNVCRVKAGGLFVIFDCLVANPTGCKHCEPFFSRFVCFHPARTEFAGKTEALAFGVNGLMPTQTTTASAPINRWRASTALRL